MKKAKWKIVISLFIWVAGLLAIELLLCDPVPEAIPPVVFTKQLQTAKLGEVLQLNGSGFTSDTVVKLWRVTSSNLQDKPNYSWVGPPIPTLSVTPPEGAIDVNVVNYTNDVLNFILPKSEVNAGVFAVYTSNDGSEWSAVPYVFNHPQVYFLSYNTVVPGSDVKAFGINLQINDVANYVFLYKSGSPLVICPIIRTSENELGFTVPSSTTAGSYQVWIHNGFAGQYGFDNSVTLNIVPPDKYPSTTYNVTQSPYHADPTGLKDSTAAIQNAINAAAENASGGVIYFPTGTYTISSPLTFTSTLANVVFRGEDKYSSIIQFSLSGTYVNEAMFSLRPPTQNANVNKTIITNLGLNTNGKRAVALDIFGRNFVTVDNVNIKADNWSSSEDLYNGVTAIQLGYNKEVTISNSVIYANNGITDTSAIDVRIYGNHIYTVYPRTNREPDNDAIQLYGTKRVSIYDNILDLNTTQNHAGTFYYYGRGVHLGGNRVYTNLFGLADASFNEDIYVGYNTINNAGKPGANDGEIIVADGSHIPGSGTVFHVTSATRNQLATSDKTGWDVSNDEEKELRGTYVYILGGKGVGQVRRIIAYTTTSITISPNWDVNPDVTSTFIINKTHTRQIFSNNRATGNQKYIGIYGEGYLNTIANNHIDAGGYDGTNGAGITLFSYLGANGNDKYPVFYNEVRGNQIIKGMVYMPNEDYISTKATIDWPISRGNVIASNTVTNFAQAVSIGGTGRPQAIWNVNTLVMNNMSGSNVAVGAVISSLSDRTVIVHLTPLSNNGTNTLEIQIPEKSYPNVRKQQEMALHKWLRLFLGVCFR